MLHIGVIGLLANEERLFCQRKLRTDSKISFLSSPSAESTQFDLILLLDNDNLGEEILSWLHEQNSTLASVLSRWKKIPSQTDLDHFIQRSLLEVYGFVVGYSEQMHTVCRWILALAHQATAALDLRTLIVGETGTGKELVAKAIYRLGMNNVGPFAALNCGGFPLELIDTELFGHKRGAFTSAVSDHVGVLQRANGGILFLDEIGELPLHLQVKLLRVLEERTFSPVGSSSVIPFSAQVISATNRRLDEAVRTGEFRSDLYFRVAQFTVLLPALRDRRDDVILLIENFLGEHDLTIDAIDQELLTRMVSYDWPGNIRELRSAIDRLVLLQRTGLKVDFHDWQIVQSTEPGQGFKEFATLADLRENFDRKVLEEVLSRHKGDTNLAAQELGITRRSVYNLARRYGVNLKKVSED